MHFLRCSFVLSGLLLVTFPVLAGVMPDPFMLQHSLFYPGTNGQALSFEGWRVAVDGNIAVIGSPHEDPGTPNAGAVKVYDATTGTLLLKLTRPQPAFSGDEYGASVAVSGNRIAVGCMRADIGAEDAGSVYVYDLLSVTPTVPVAVLTNPTPAQLELFGSSVSISGTLLAIGSFADKDSDNSGSAYVYDLAATAPLRPWITLTNPAAGLNDFFGNAVAIDGHRLVVGAIYKDIAEFNDGGAYLYDLTSATPTIPLLTFTNPRPARHGEFGASVALSGIWLVIGEPGDSSQQFAAGSAYAYELESATPEVPAMRLAKSVPEQFDSFGSAVAISGTRVVVGAYHDGTAEAGAGKAYVFDIGASTSGVPSLVLIPPNPHQNDWFGSTVAIAGSRIVVGAPKADLEATDTGAAYVYDLDGATPAASTMTLHYPSPTPSDYFGTSVGISGSWAVIGTPNDDTGDTDAGRVYVYNLASATPRSHVFALDNPTPKMIDVFGWSVGISGSKVVVGAYGDDTGSSDAGAAYVFNLAGGQPGASVLTFTNPQPSLGALFGYTVAISSNRVIAGAPFDDTGATDAGIAYAYDLSRAIPGVPALTLTNPSPAASDNFGRAVAISGTRIIVGAHRDDTGATGAGVAYIYDMASAQPGVPVFILTNPSPAASDLFGIAVAINGATAIVGAQADDTGAINAGTAYVYKLLGPTPALPVLTLTNPYPAAGDFFGHAVGVSDDLVVVGAHRSDLKATDAGLAYVYALDGDQPDSPIATLAAARPAANDNFGAAVAISGRTIVTGTPNSGGSVYNGGGAFIFGPLPELKIAPITGELASLSWCPVNLPGFVLQHSDHAPMNWTNAPSGTNNPANISTTNATRFYRLLQQ